MARERRVSLRDFLHEADWSACHATGRLRLRSGTGATWTIGRFGAGTLTIGGRRHYFDCAQCRYVARSSQAPSQALANGRLRSR